MKTAPTTLLSKAIRMSLYGMSVVAIFSFFVNLLVLVSPIYMQQVYDRVLTTHHLDTLAYLSLFTVICLVFLSLFDGARSYALTRVGRWWDETLRANILHAALYHSRVSGRLATSALNDLQAVRAFVGSPNILPFFDAPWMPAFLLIITLIYPMLGAIGVGGAIILFSLAVWNDIATRKAMIATSERSMRMNNFTNTSLRHADVVHAMGMFHSVAERIDQLGKEISEVTQVASDRTSIISAITKSVRIGIQVAILGVGAYFVTRNEMTAGGMIAASIILGRALTPVEQALGAWKSFTAARLAYMRLGALIAQAPPLGQHTNLPPPTGRLSVENSSSGCPAARSRPCATSTSASSPAPLSPSSAPPLPARARCANCWSARGARVPAMSGSTAPISPAWIATRSAATSATCRNRSSCSAGPSATISPGSAMQPTRKWWRPPRPRAATR